MKRNENNSTFAGCGYFPIFVSVFMAAILLSASCDDGGSVKEQQREEKAAVTANDISWTLPLNGPAGGFARLSAKQAWADKFQSRWSLRDVRMQTGIPGRSEPLKVEAKHATWEVSSGKLELGEEVSLELGGGIRLNSGKLLFSLADGLWNLEGGVRLETEGVLLKADSASASLHDQAKGIELEKPVAIFSAKDRKEKR